MAKWKIEARIEFTVEAETFDEAKDKFDDIMHYGTDEIDFDDYEEEIIGIVQQTRGGKNG